MKRVGSVAILSLLAVLMFSSCKRNQYTCWCRVVQPGGAVIEEQPLGLISNNLAQKKCADYQDSRTEDFVGYPKQIRCQVQTDL